MRDELRYETAGPGWSRLVQAGPGWSRLVQVGPGWSRLVKSTVTLMGRSSAIVSHGDKITPICPCTYGISYPPL